MMESLIKEAPMIPEDKLKELEEIRRLVSEGKVGVTGWSDERYQELHDSLMIMMNNEQKGVS